MNDLNSWDMLVLDDEGEELKRFEGNGHGAPGYSRAIKTKYSDDDEFVMWLKSPCEISIMDLSDFSEIHLENFWKYKQEDVCATSIAANREATNIAGIGFVPKMSNIQTLHLWKDRIEHNVIEMRTIHKDVAAWLCLELSSDSSTIFVGGSESLSLVSGDGFIFALGFDKKTSIEGFKRLNSEAEEVNCVNVIRRY